MADRRSDLEELRNIERILATGATSVSVDGRTVNYDFAQLRIRARELRARVEGSPNRAVRTIDLSRAF